MYTTEQVRRAYEINGLKPCAYGISPERGKCCALGALCNGKAESVEHARRILNWNGVAAFGVGFDTGFEGHLPSHMPYYSQFPAFKNGYEIGVALRNEPPDN